MTMKNSGFEDKSEIYHQEVVEEIRSRSGSTDRQNGREKSLLQPSIKFQSLAENMQQDLPVEATKREQAFLLQAIPPARELTAPASLCLYWRKAMSTIQIQRI